jgi:drug/metabolite transporter (DMT)-like permease
MIFFNKFVLDQLKFPFPMFLCTWHMVLATILTRIMASTTNMLPGVRDKKVDGAAMKTKIFPVACFFAVSLILSNNAYIYLSVSYIQMLKAFTPVAVLVFSFFAGLEKSSMMEVYIVSLICIGVAMTSVGETFFSWTGFTFQSLAICAESSRLVLTNVLLKELKLDPLSSLYYIAPPCAFLIGSLCLYFEAAELPWDRIVTPLFGIVMIANGLVAFALNVAVVMLISNTSALVLTLAGIAKDLLIVSLSVLLFGTPITNLQCFGYGLALLGLNMHKEYKKDPDFFTQLVSSSAFGKSMGLVEIDMDLDMDQL